MNIVSIQKLSMVDYPGKMACVLFMKGCNYLCPFCHNKDLVVNSKDVPTLSEEEVFDFLFKRKAVLDAVVISGGEPTLDPDLVSLIKRIKEMGYLVKLDTNGTNSEILQYFIKNKLVDYVAMDVKNCEEKYSLTSGVKDPHMDEIKRSINLLINSDVPYEFRMTVMVETHKVEDAKSLGTMLKGAKLLVLQRYEDSPNCIVGGFTPMDEYDIRKYRAALSDYLPIVHTRGYPFS